MKMLSKVHDYINQFHMIEEGDRIVVGVSGGADSVCLLFILQEHCQKCGASLMVVHINHGLRGKEADRDEQFVRELCGRLRVEFYLFTYDIRKLAAKEGLTEEEAGRNARYQAFLEVCKQHQGNKIAVAHNKNDLAETMLFNLFRGSGLKGLSGIEAKRVISTDFGNIILIRPLLGTERKEIETYLGQKGITFVTDSTNLGEDYSRNKIRNRVLTYATEQINTQAVGNIYETALKIREAMEYIENNVAQCYQVLVKQELGTYYLLVEDFVKEPVVIQKGLIRKILEELAGNLKDLEAKHVDTVLSLMEKQVGRYMHLPYSIVAERDYKELRIYQDKEIQDSKVMDIVMEPVKVAIPGTTYIPQKGRIFVTELRKYEKNEPIPKSSCMKWFDYDKIENAVEIRSRREGDFIQINGLGGRKKLKDYFIDHKIPKQLRDSQLLVTDGSHIIWLPGDGERMSEKYKVVDATTTVLSMKMIIVEEKDDDR